MTASIGVGLIDSKRGGLPCRVNCGFVAYPATDHQRDHLLVAIASRNDHEQNDHGYVHQITATAKSWTPFNKGIRSPDVSRVTAATRAPRRRGTARS